MPIRMLIKPMKRVFKYVVAETTGFLFQPTGDQFFVKPGDYIFDEVTSDTRTRFVVSPEELAKKFVNYFEETSDYAQLMIMASSDKSEVELFIPDQIQGFFTNVNGSDQIVEFVGRPGIIYENGKEKCDSLKNIFRNYSCTNQEDQLTINKILLTNEKFAKNLNDKNWAIIKDLIQCDVELNNTKKDIDIFNFNIENIKKIINCIPKELETKVEIMEILSNIKTHIDLINIKKPPILEPKQAPTSTEMNWKLFDTTDKIPPTITEPSNSTFNELRMPANFSKKDMVQETTAKTETSLVLVSDSNLTFDKKVKNDSNETDDIFKKHSYEVKTFSRLE